MLKRLLSINYALSIIVAVILLNTNGLIAQTTDADLTKKLIGKWEGTRATKYGPFQTLIIKSVKREGDQLIATGNYGTTDKKLSPTKINVIANGNDVVLELFFTSKIGNDIDLRLVGDELIGLTEAARGRKRIHADMTLKKVQ
jgi:hypothetical protein